MSAKPSTPEPETSRQYGVTYPDGRTFWLSTETSNQPAALPGASTVKSLVTAADRGAFIDQWRQSVIGCGLDPDAVSKPKFVSRDIVKTYADAAPVVDA